MIEFMILLSYYTTVMKWLLLLLVIPVSKYTSVSDKVRKLNEFPSSTIHYDTPPPPFAALSSSRL